MELEAVPESRNVVPHSLLGPILALADYRMEEYFDGTIVPVCLTQADTFWPAFFFIFSIVMFFFLPSMILVILYTIIARHLMKHPGIIAPCRHHRHLDQLGAVRPSSARHNHHSALRYRKQVVLMLATVVFAFFVCLMPFRALTLWIIVVSDETKYSLDVETYYNLLYFCRIMIYINSSINPILYNLMSSKFREGFLRLCHCHHTMHHRLRGDLTSSQQKGTFIATSTCSSNPHNSVRSSPHGSFWRLGLARKSSSSSTSSSAGNKMTGSLKMSVRNCGVIASSRRSFHRTNSSTAAVENGNNNTIKSGQQMLQRSKSHSLSHHHRVVCDAIDEVGTVKTSLVMTETSKPESSTAGAKSEESYV